MGHTFKDSLEELNKFIEDEVVFKGIVKRGGRPSNKVRNVQEWLVYHHFNLLIDRSFGPITENKVREFQIANNLPPTGIVDEDTHKALVAPMVEVLRAPRVAGTSLNSAIVTHARIHLAASPVEIGGPNCGPWVRLYMRGKHGEEQLWCAGFIRFIMLQASETSGESLPIPGDSSCDVFAGQAKNKNLFVRGLGVDKSRLVPGSIFLSRRSSTDWYHAGIITNAGGISFETIEGNTNAIQGSNGVGVFSLTRGYEDYDFIVLDNAVRDPLNLSSGENLVVNTQEVEVRRYFYDSERVTTYGSLFKYWGGWITAGHVLRDTELNTPPYAIGDLVYQPAGLDGALIGCNLPSQQPPNLTENMSIVVCGFPAGSHIAAKRNGVAYFYHKPDSAETYGKWIVRIDEPHEPVVSGMSGGVAVDAATGVALGIIVEANHKADLDSDPEKDHSLNIVSLYDMWDAAKNGSGNS